MKRIIIVGAGPAGLACGIWLRRLGHDPLIIEKGRIGGMLHSIHGRIPDYLGRIAENGSDLAGYFTEHAKELSLKIETNIEAIGIEDHKLIVKKWSVGTEDHRYHKVKDTLPFEKKGDDFHTEFEYIESLSFDACLIATGLRRKRLTIPGADQGVLYSQAGIRFYEKDVLIVGGGDGALENALKIAETARRVIVAYRSHLRARPDFISEAVKKGIELIPCIPVKIEHHETSELFDFIYEINGSKESLTVDSILVKIGFEPCVISGPGCDERGYITVNNEMQTTMKGVWAAGDVISPEYPSISLATGQASVAAKSMERYLRNINA